jgi:hypothetical protein
MKQTSIEFFANEVFNIIQLHSDGKISSVKSIVDIAEAKQTAKEIYEQEMSSNCSQHVTENHTLEISDEEIEKEASRILWQEARETFKMGAKWYREKLKNADKKS